MGKVERPRIQTKQQAAKARKVSEAAVQEIFDYWKQIVSPSSRAILDDLRVIKIGWAIHDYGMDACKQAIDGIAKSDFHMGNNPRNRKYNDVELIFRSADNVERFMGMAEKRDARAEFLKDSSW
jgi:hypothetical protein